MEVIKLSELPVQVAQWSEEDQLRRATLLVLAYHLSTLQINVAFDIEQLYRKHKFYSFNIKHNHEKIKKLLRKNHAGDYYSDISEEGLEKLATDAEIFEMMVYAWVGLEHPKGIAGDIPAVNLNLMAREAYESALRRGKIGRYPSALLQIGKIKEELNELMNASGNRSIHINYTEQQEEAADVIISTLTLLHGQGVDINQLLIDKMEYNANRKD